MAQRLADVDERLLWQLAAVGLRVSSSRFSITTSRQLSGVPWRPARLISSSIRSASAAAGRHTIAPCGKRVCTEVQVAGPAYVSIIVNPSRSLKHPRPDPSPSAGTPGSVLQELNVENLLLIERAQLRLAPGLNVLTGETGAGKTVLAHALDLLLGGRAGGTGTQPIMRPGASEAYVEGVFDLPDSLRAELAERLPDGAGEIVLARRLGADGRTRAYLNGRSATVAELRDLGSRLVSFYGQHEHRKLTLAGAQLEILDALCGPEHALRLRACAKTFAEIRRLAAELDSLRELSSARERELDLLEHELSEIDAAGLDQQEHDELLLARERLRRLDALRSAAGAGAEALAPEDASDGLGASQLMAGAAAGLDALAGVDRSLDALAERLRALVIESQDLAGELRGYCERLARRGRLARAVEERLASIERWCASTAGRSPPCSTTPPTRVRGARSWRRRGRARRRPRRSWARRARRSTGHVSALRDARELPPRAWAARCASSSRRWRWATPTFEVSLARASRAPRRRRRRVHDRAQPRRAGRPAARDRLRRRALARDARDHDVPARPPAAAAPRGAPCSRRRRRSCSTRSTPASAAIPRARSARACASWRRQAGAVHHPPAPDRLARRPSLLDRQGHLRRRRRARPSSQLAEGEVVSELVRMLGADADDGAARATRASCARPPETADDRRLAASSVARVRSTPRFLRPCEA